jgi:FAD synthase
MNIFETDFYGEELRFIVVGYLRDEQNYPSLGMTAEKLTN